nr:unnamed protein product [Callosobruchus analis]
MAGAAAGLLAIGITTPMELLKIQMQDAGRINAQLIKSGQPPMDVTLTKVVMNMVKAEGPLAFFKGASATMLRDIKFAMIYFPLFAKLNAVGPKKEGSGESQFWVNFLAGGGAGCTAAVLCTPADVIKTRLQTATKGKGENTYTGIMDAFSTILRNEGPKAFFKGGACRAMVITPLLAIVQVIYYIGIAEYLLGIERP